MQTDKRARTRGNTHVTHPSLSRHVVSPEDGREFPHPSTDDRDGGTDSWMNISAAACHRCLPQDIEVTAS